MKWGFDEKGFWLTNSLKLSLLLWVLLLPNQTQAQTNSCLAKFGSLTFFQCLTHVTLTCHSTVHHIQCSLHFVKSVVLAWVGAAHLRCQMFGLNLGAEGQTVRLRGPRSLFHQTFNLNLVLAIISILLLETYVHNHPNNLVL